MKSRLLELAGLFLIGDGLMGLLRPRRHSLLWHIGPQLAKAVTEELAEHPNTARSIYAAELALGIAVASIALSDVDDYIEKEELRIRKGRCSRPFPFLNSYI